MNKKKTGPSEKQLLRQKAERQLKNNQEKFDELEFEDDPLKMLHELRVHHVELEMQNEELKSAYATVEETLKKYTLLYELAPMGYFTLNKDCFICELNFTGAEILGEQRYTLINRSFRLFVSETSLSDFNEFFNKIYTSYSKESCLAILKSSVNPNKKVYMEAVVTGDDQNCLLSVVDISNLKNIE